MVQEVSQSTVLNLAVLFAFVVLALVFVDITTGAIGDLEGTTGAVAGLIPLVLAIIVVLILFQQGEFRVTGA